MSSSQRRSSNATPSSSKRRASVHPRSRPPPPESLLLLTIEYISTWTIDLTDNSDVGQYAPTTHRLNENDFALLVSLPQIDEQLQLRERALAAARLQNANSTGSNHPAAEESIEEDGPLAVIENSNIFIRVGFNGVDYPTAKVEVLNLVTRTIRVIWPTVNLRRDSTSIEVSSESSASPPRRRRSSRAASKAASRKWKTPKEEIESESDGDDDTYQVGRRSQRPPKMPRLSGGKRTSNHGGRDEEEYEEAEHEEAEHEELYQHINARQKAEPRIRVPSESRLHAVEIYQELENVYEQLDRMREELSRNARMYANCRCPH